MLPSAFASLTNPCLPDFWSTQYPAAAGAIVEASIFIMFVTDFALRRYIWKVSDLNRIEEITARTEKLGVSFLEAGIIFHSIFIGLTLSISTGTDFYSLWVTIIFHRMLPTNASSHYRDV